MVSIKDKLDDTEIKYEEIKKLYKPTEMKIFDLDLFEESIESYAKIVETSNLIDRKAKIKPKSYLTLMRRYSLFYMSLQGWKLMEEYSNINNIKYSKIIKIRADFERGGYYPKINWDQKIPRDTILIGDWNLQKYSKLDSRIKFDFQDHFALGEFENMRYYFNIFNNLHKLSKDFRYKPKMWHAEYCLSFWLMKNNIKCQIIKRNNLEKGRFEYLEIGSTFSNTLLEFYKDKDIRGLSLEPDPQLFNKLKKFYKKSKNKFFENSAINFNYKEKINLYFVDQNKINNLKSINLLGIGYKSLEKLKSNFKEVTDSELKENMIKKISVSNLSFKQLLEKYNIDSIGFLKIHKEGVDFQTFISIFESGIKIDAIQFDERDFIDDLQVRKVISFLENNHYICRDLANKKNNYYCAKKHINFDKYLYLNYKTKANWISRIKNKNKYINSLIVYLKTAKYFLKKFIS